MAKQGEEPSAPAAVPKERAKALSQTAFPSSSLQKALLIPNAILDNFGGKSGNPIQVALAIKWTPTGGAWRALAGSSMAYGLTEGSYSASEIKLTPRGSAVVAPTEEGADKAALREALLTPTIMRAFVEKYDNAKFPTREIGINMLSQLGLPRERCADGYDLIQENLQFVGALQPTKNGHMVLLSTIGAAIIPKTAQDSDEKLPTFGNGQASQAPPFVPAPVTPSMPAPQLRPNTRVFISHGKNRELIEHLKKLVTYAKLTPVISVEITDTSKPVPQKVLEEMRSCFGGIVHVNSEGVWTDGDGKEHPKINDNVLIEIGAAMAMYKGNFILLVQKGTTLPSNLQGLFVCKYEGERMDGDATMQLLEGLSKFDLSA